VRRPAAIVLLVALLTAGCGFKHEPTGTLPVQFPVTISDAAGRSITLETPPQVIVAMDPAGARILKSVGAKAVVVPSTTTIAALKAQHPDLVVLSPQTSPARADAMARALGVPTYVLAGYALASIERGAAALGLATGHGLAGRDLALKWRARRQKIEQAIASATPQTVFADQGFGYSIAPDELLATLIKDARGTLVGATGAQPIAQAKLAALDPDVYLLEQSSNLTLKGLRKLKLTAGLQAVRSGRVLVVDDKTIEPDQDAYTLLEQIAHFLHPESLP
jgi:iron complex transport system substrate-binding protein